MRHEAFKRWYLNYRPAVALSFGILLIAGSVIFFIVTARGAGRSFVEYEVSELADALILRAQEIIKINTRAGIDLDRMVAFDEVLSKLIQERREIAFMVLLGTGGRVIAFAGRTGITPENYFLENKIASLNQDPLRFGMHRSYVYTDQGSMGSIVVGVDLHRLDQEIFLIAIDSLIAAIVAAVIMREIVKVIIARSTLNRLMTFRAVTKSTTRNEAVFGKQRQLVSAIRLVTFLMAFSEELIRPFLSIYIGEELRSSWLITPTVMVSTTLCASAIFNATAQIFGPFLAGRLSFRYVLSIALFTMLIGSGLFAISNDWLVAIIGRSLTGIGFGLALIVGQASILHTANQSDQLQEVGNVAAAMVAAGLCGPLIGGLLADHFGYQFVLVFACAVALAAFVISFRITEIRSLRITNKQRTTTKMGIRKAFFSRSTYFLIAFAVPIKIGAAGMLFYVAPLAVIRDGESLMMAGRMIAIYFVGYLMIQPVGNRLLASGTTPSRLVAVTSAINTVACCTSLVSGITTLAVSMIFFGAAHALSNTAQLSLYFDAAKIRGDRSQQTQFLGIYRLAERLGGIIGLFICVFIDAWGGLESTIMTLSIIAIISFLMTSILIMVNKFKPELEWEIR